MTHPLPKRHRLRRAAKATVKLTAWSGFGAFMALVLMMGIGWILYRNGTLDRWFESRWKKRFIAEQIARIQPHIPFKIEKVEIDASLKEIKAGRIRDLHVVLSFRDWRGDFHGKLNIDSLFKTTLKQRDVRLKIEYLPEVWVEWKGSRTTPFSLSLTTEIDGNLTKGIELPQNMKAVISAETFKFAGIVMTGEKPSTIEIKKPAFDLNLHEGLIHSSLKWEDLSVTHTDLQAHLEAFEIQMTSNAVEQLKKHSEAFDFSVAIHPTRSASVKPIQSIEVLKGDDYFTLPWHSRWGFDASGILSTSKTALKIENTPFQLLKAKVTLAKENAFSLEIKPRALRTRLKTVEIKDLLALLALQPARFFPEAVKEKLLIEKGVVEVEADSHGGTLNNGSIKISVRDLAARAPTAQFALQGMRAFTEASWSRKESSPPDLKLEKFETAISRFGFRNLRGSLAPTSVRLQGQKIEFLPKLGLTLESFPLRMGVTEIRLTEKGPELQTQLKLDPVSLEQVNQLFCLGMKRPAPVTLFGDLKKITLNREVFDPEGTLEAKLFNGWARVENIAVYDPTTAVPEIDFDLSWGGVKLSSMVDWLGFGEMNGIIEGYSKDTVFQAWLPTHYDFSVSVIPDRDKDVVFSPEAMKNFVQLFAADALEQLPGIVNWAVWGWPSRMLGGFDVDYAGFSLFADGGAILLETHDKPEILEKENGKHFFLYGSRFKMPLTGSAYPRVLDAPALATLTHRIKKQLDTIAENKKLKAAQEKGREKEMESSKNAPSNTISSEKTHENADSETPICQPQL